jgi:protein translocase SEC61 complex gamma subunit
MATRRETSRSRMQTASFYRRAIRILKIAKRPDRSEVFLVIKITVVGMFLIGLIAFLIRNIMEFILGSF